MKTILMIFVVASNLLLQALTYDIVNKDENEEVTLIGPTFFFKLLKIYKKRKDKKLIWLFILDIVFLLGFLFLFFYSISTR